MQTLVDVADVLTNGIFASHSRTRARVMRPYCIILLARRSQVNRDRKAVASRSYINDDKGLQRRVVLTAPEMRIGRGAYIASTGKEGRL